MGSYLKKKKKVRSYSVVGYLEVIDVILLDCPPFLSKCRGIFELQK